MHRRTDKGRAKQLLRGGGRRGNCAYTKNNNVRSVNDRCKEQKYKYSGFYNINKILIPFNTKNKTLRRRPQTFTEMRNIPEKYKNQLKSTSRLI
jgi:hypothetical protein